MQETFRKCVENIEKNIFENWKREILVKEIKSKCCASSEEMNQ